MVNHALAIDEIESPFPKRRSKGGRLNNMKKWIRAEIMRGIHCKSRSNSQKLALLTLANVIGNPADSNSHF